MTGRPATGDPQARAPSLLIVEDDWFIATDIRAIATEAGYLVVAMASSADEAVAAALAHRPDLALLDIRLVGERDGIDAALEIRRHLETAILMVTAHEDEALRRRLAPAAPRGWLLKPFSQPQLLAAIKAALEPCAATP